MYNFITSMRFKKDIDLFLSKNDELSCKMQIYGKRNISVRREYIQKKAKIIYLSVVNYIQFMNQEKKEREVK